MRIIVSAGGTGGHIYPALAIIKKFQEQEKDLEVLYIGTHNRMEKDIVPKMGYKYEALEIYGFSKTKIIQDLKNALLIKKAYQKCLNIMQDFKPDVVIGVGGYVTYPVIKAAKKLGIKTVLHEQNSIPGKSNIWLSKNIDLICVSSESTLNSFPKAKKVIYTGNPCGDGAINLEKIKKESLGFKPNKKLIIIVAGSLGSKTLNEKFKPFLNLIDEEDYEVLYIAGKNLYADFVKDTNFPANVKVVPYMDNLSALMKDAYLIITRAGASTISELLALNVPSILIPSPYVANNHQYYNALDLVNLGVAELIEEKNLKADILQITINELINNEEKYTAMVEKLKKIAVKPASDTIYQEIKEILK